MSRPSNCDSVYAIGIDPGKTMFHLVGLNESGANALRERTSRTKAAARLANLPTCLIGLRMLQDLAAIGANSMSASRL